MIAVADVAAGNEEIRAAATMASLSLALLGIFTNLRRESLKEYLEVVTPFDKDTVFGLLPDLGLAALTGWAVLAMTPLCFDTFHFCEIGRRGGAVPSLFALIWLGFVVVLLLQLSFAVIRVVSALNAGSNGGE
jgi:hypothetical protein